eukprot:jgi/Ulvmu1/5638/UM230_0001.1
MLSMQPQADMLLHSTCAAQPPPIPFGSKILLAAPCGEEGCQLKQELEGCDTDADVAAALRRFAESRRATLPTLTKLIARYGKSKLWRRGVAIFANVHLLGHIPDTELANAALFACLRAGDSAAAGAAWGVYMTMHRLLVPLDRVSFKALLPVLAGDGRWQACLECFVAGVHGGTAMDGSACLALLQALKRAGHWRLAEAALLCMLPCPELLSHKEQCAVAADEVAGAGHGLGSVLHALRELCEVSFDRVRAVADIDEFDERFLQGGMCDAQQSMCSVQALISTLRSITPTAAAEPSNRGMLVTKRQQPPFLDEPLATACCNTLLLMYSQAAPPQPARAVSLLVSMAKFYAAGGALAPDTLSYNIVIKLLCNPVCGLREEALAFAHVLLESQLRHTEATFEPMLAAAHAAGDHAAMLSTQRAAAASGVYLQGLPCTAVVHEGASDDGVAGAPVRGADKITAVSSRQKRRPAATSATAVGFGMHLSMLQPAARSMAVKPAPAPALPTSDRLAPSVAQAHAPLRRTLAGPVPLAATARTTVAVEADAALRWWSMFKSEAVTPADVCCIMFISTAAKASTSGTEPAAEALLLNSAAESDWQWHMPATAAAFISREANLILSVLATTSDDCVPADATQSLKASGVTVSDAMAALCCAHMKMRGCQCCMPAAMRCGGSSGACLAATAPPPADMLVQF